MAHDIQTTDLDETHVLYIHRSAPQEELGTVFGECFPAVFQYAMENGIELAGAPFARYHSFSPAGIEVDAGIPIASAAAGKDQIQYGTIAGGKHVMTIHTGPYDTLNLAHSAIEAWLAENGKAPTGPNWESYVTDPGEAPPEEWQTFVYWPID